jgi:hypothetical protein
MLKELSRTIEKDVSVKLALPKDLHWKVFGKLVKDLGLITDAEQCANPYINSFGNEAIEFAIRTRDSKRLTAAVEGFSPRCMTETEYEADNFFAKYQLNSFLRKFPGKGPDAKKAAIEKFLRTEEACATFNRENYRALLALSKRHPDFLGFIEEIRSDISDLLGETPPLEKIEGLSKHGPGTSYIGKLYEQGCTTPFFKWSRLPYSVTKKCVPYAKKIILDDPRWIGALDDEYRHRTSNLLGPIDTDAFWAHVLEIVPGSRLTSVPKSAEIERTICIEPLINVMLQLGTDSYIKGRLKRLWKYDLSTQEYNQILAKEASEYGTFATVDLSSASDMISLMICLLFLPEAWYSYLIDLRSPGTEIDGKFVPLEKISSMGNGYTFALETVIFAALTRYAIKKSKTQERRSAVYGDDIVIPTAAYPILKELLSLCGFSVNTEKSFSDGPFRESCGADFYKGINVRPLFLKKELKTVPDLLYLHNSLWNLEEKVKWPLGFDFKETRAFIRKYLPQHVLKCYGPPSDSTDTYLFSNKKLKRNKGGFYLVRSIEPRAKIYRKNFKDYFFVKLMNNLSGDKKRPQKWDLKRTMDTGNSFDITRRDRVTYNLTLAKVWKTD